MSEACNKSNNYTYESLTDLSKEEKGYVISNFFGIFTNGYIILLYMWGIWHAKKT